MKREIWEKKINWIGFEYDSKYNIHRQDINYSSKLYIVISFILSQPELLWKEIQNNIKYLLTKICNTKYWNKKPYNTKDVKLRMI